MKLKETNERLRKQTDEGQEFHDRQLRALRAQYDTLRYNSNNLEFRKMMGVDIGNNDHSKQEVSSSSTSSKDKGYYTSIKDDDKPYSKQNMEKSVFIN